MDLPKKGQKVVYFEDIVTQVHPPTRSEMTDEAK